MSADGGGRTCAGRPTTNFVSAGTRFIVDARYELIKAIGHGAYGVVVSARDNDTGGKVAIKKIPCVFEDAVDAKRVLREIKLLRHFRHDNIIGLIDLQPPPTAVLADFVDIYMVFELLETDMQRVISSRQVLSEDHIKYFVYQLLRGVKGLHSAGVIHRDLKPSNLLLNADCDLKVCDLGLARGITRSERGSAADLTPRKSASSKTGQDGGTGVAEEEEPDQTGSELLTEYVVTRWYRAPEIMLSCSEYTRAVDMWAVGCIITELYLRKTLFPGKDYIHQLRLIADVCGTPPDEELNFVKSKKARRFMSDMRRREPRDFRELLPTASAEAIDMITRLLVWHPERRMTAVEALRHPCVLLLLSLRACPHARISASCARVTHPLHSLISYYSLLLTPLTPCRFMSPLNECEEEPDADAFEWSGEGRTLAKEDLRAMIYSEIREIHPACPAGR